MFCSIPSMIIFFWMWYAVKNNSQNKLKSLKPCFLKIILPFFPAVACVFVCVCSVLPLPHSASWSSSWRKAAVDCLSVCCTTLERKSKRAGAAFFLLAHILAWGKTGNTNVAMLAPAVLGCVLACGRAVCWHLGTPVLLLLRQHLCGGQKAVWEGLKI